MAVINNNVKNIQFLRNAAIYANREAARAALETNKALVGDGSALLARYSGETATDIKTVVGFVWNDGTNKTVTIFDIEDAGADVQKLIDEINDKLGDDVTSANTVSDQLAALSGTNADTSATTSVAGAKAYTDDKIGTLDYTGVTTGDGKVIVNVTESDGIVSGTTAEVGGLKLTDYSKGSDSGAVTTSDTINTAISKLENQIDAANDASTGAIKTAIEALDYSGVTTGTGVYVTNVTETDGVVAATTATLPTVAEISETGKPIIAVAEDKGTLAASAGTINAEYVNVADTDGNLTATTVEGALAEIFSGYTAGDAALKGDATTSGDTLGKLEDRIEALDADAKEYQLSAITESLPETVKERYALVDGDGNVSGTTIDIPKDSHIVSIDYSGTTQKLYYTYIDVSGNTQTTEVDMSELVLETEFGSGVTVTDHVAHGVVDPTSEAFLTVGTNGFKLSGVQDAIDTAISGLDVSDTAVAGQYVSEVSETDGEISVQRADVSSAVLNNYSKGSDATAVAATDTINQAISKLENQIDAAEAAAAAAATVVELETGTSHVTVSSAQDATTRAVTYTIGENDIASQTELEALSGKAVTEIASSNASISATSSTTADGTVKYDLVTDASKIKMSGFTADASGFTAISESSSVTEAFKAVEDYVLANEAVVSGALNDLEADKLENIVVNGVTGTTGANNTASVTIDGADITLDGYEKPSSTAAITSGDTVNQAIGKLEKGLESAVSGGLQGVTINGSGTTVTSNIASFTVDGATSAMTGSNNQAVVVDTDATGNLTIGLDTIDAGTY